jgi:predicted small lipoprotein YifL
MIRIPMLLAVLLLAAACGRKGDLYLPDEEREVIGRVPVNTGVAAPAETASAATDEDAERHDATPSAAGPAGAAQ